MKKKMTKDKRNILFWTGVYVWKIPEKSFFIFVWIAQMHSQAIFFVYTFYLNETVQKSKTTIFIWAACHVCVMLFERFGCFLFYFQCENVDFRKKRNVYKKQNAIKMSTRVKWIFVFIIIVIIICTIFSWIL